MIRVRVVYFSQADPKGRVINSICLADVGPVPRTSFFTRNDADGSVPDPFLTKLYPDWLHTGAALSILDLLITQLHSNLSWCRTASTNLGSIMASSFTHFSSNLSWNVTVIGPILAPNWFQIGRAAGGRLEHVYFSIEWHSNDRLFSFDFELKYCYI